MSEAAPPVERWLATHADAVALLLVLLGLLARLRAANAPFLQPDEVLHIRIASAPTLAAVYRESLTNAHPPLFYFLLRPWALAVGSDWARRLLPVAFGTAFLWFAWLWARTALGAACGLIVVSCLAFLPAIVVVSSELRAYPLMLLLVAAALWALEQALAVGSKARLWLFTVLGALALSSQYSALLFLAGAFVYAAVRIGTGRPPARFLLVWAAGQLILAALLVFYVVTHISKLRGSPPEREAHDIWLPESFLKEGQSAAAFLARRTLSLFQYFFSTSPGGAVALALFVGGVAWLAARRRPVVFLLALPLALTAAGGLLAVYPYGGTRHDVVLALFAVSGTGVALARLAGDRLWAALAVAAALVGSAFLISG
jgi:hypothetical protein